MAKADEKYNWNRPSQALPTIDPHSKIKHQIIEEYLQTYVQVLMSNPNIPDLKLSIVDGFCGGGQYRDINGDDHFGSPIIALRAIQEAEALINVDRIQSRRVITQYFFTDIKQANINCLRAVLDMQGYKHRLEQDIFLRCSDFTNALPSITTQIKGFNRKGRALFLLDQYAYADVPFPRIREIFHSFTNAEVLLTFNVDSLTDYLADRQENRKALENIGLDKHIPWALLRNIKANNRSDWRYVIQRSLSEGILTESSAKFMTIFFITPYGASPRTYWFIHLANSYRANDVMKAIHWKHGNHFSHQLSPSLFFGYDANRDIDVTAQGDLALGEEHHFDGVTENRIYDELSELLPRELYEQKPQTFGSLMGKLTNFTMADEQLIKHSLGASIGNRDLVVIDKNGKTKRRKGSSIRLTDTVMASPQRTLFFIPPTIKVR
nr:three-Cys-motif partner protein TcmP [uncultured Halomonas sp.]